MTTKTKAPVQVALTGWHLDMVNAATNTNKFYDVFLSEDGHVIIQWGRIGTQGQCKVDKLDYEGAKAIALRQVYGKASKGYRTVVSEFKFHVGIDVLQQAVDSQFVGRVQQAFGAAQRDNTYGGERDAVYKHYDSFIEQAQRLMDRAADLDIGEVMDEWAQIQGAFEEINVKHQTAVTTITLTQQMVSQKLMGVMAADEKHLLIARINGKSSSRRQRGFLGTVATVKAIKRWEAEGFNGFWVYGPREDGDRGLIGSFHREQPNERAVVITALGGTP